MDILAQTIEMGPSLVLHQKDVISPLYFHPNSFFLLGVTQKTCKNLHSSRRYQQPVISNDSSSILCLCCWKREASIDFFIRGEGRFDVLRMEWKKGVFTWAVFGKVMIGTWEHNSLLKIKISVFQQSDFIMFSKHQNSDTFHQNWYDFKSHKRLCWATSWQPLTRLRYTLPVPFCLMGIIID